MNQTIGGDKRAIMDCDVTGQQRSTGHYDVVAEGNIVRDVAMLHQKIVRAYNRLFLNLARAMHGDVLPKDIIFSDAQPGWFVAILQVLWRFSDNAARKKLVPRANGRASG